MTEYEAITETVMNEYKNMGLDSLHLYIHAINEEDATDFGDYKAHGFIAFTQKGAAQTGLEKANTFKVEE